VEVESEYIDELKAARIKNAWLVENEVEEGGVARIRLALRKKFQERDEIKEIAFPLPKEVRRGSELTIRVGGGSSMFLEKPPATCLDELIETLDRYYKADLVVAEAEIPSFVLLYKGKELQRMPPSIVSQLAPILQDEALLGSVRVRNVVQSDIVITGTASVTVRVK
jgi:hypothetical protein